MRTLSLFVLAILPVFPQTVVPIKVKAGNIERTWSITLREPTVLAGFGCDLSEMEPGAVTLCVLFRNQKAPTPMDVTVTIPAGFTGPSLVTIPAGEVEARFKVTRNGGETKAVILPTAITLWAGDRRAHAVDLSGPCCARADGCGLPADRIAWEPCR